MTGLSVSVISLPSRAFLDLIEAQLMLWDLRKEKSGGVGHIDNRGIEPRKRERDCLVVSRDPHSDERAHLRFAISFGQTRRRRRKGKKNFRELGLIVLCCSAGSGDVASNKITKDLERASLPISPIFPLSLFLSNVLFSALYALEAFGTVRFHCFTPATHQFNPISA